MANSQPASKSSKVRRRAVCRLVRAEHANDVYFSSFFAHVHQGSKSCSAAPEAQKVPQPIFWVKCDECDRWRIINGLTHEEQTKLMKKSWFCKMHPDIAQRECDKVVSVPLCSGALPAGSHTSSGETRQKLAASGALEFYRILSPVQLHCTQNTPSNHS